MQLQMAQTSEGPVPVSVLSDKDLRRKIRFYEGYARYLRDLAILPETPAQYEKRLQAECAQRIRDFEQSIAEESDHGRTMSEQPITCAGCGVEYSGGGQECPKCEGGDAKVIPTDLEMFLRTKVEKDANGAVIPYVSRGGMIISNGHPRHTGLFTKDGAMLPMVKSFEARLDSADDVVVANVQILCPSIELMPWETICHVIPAIKGSDVVEWLETEIAFHRGEASRCAKELAAPADMATAEDCVFHETRTEAFQEVLEFLCPNRKGA